MGLPLFYDTFVDVALRVPECSRLLVVDCSTIMSLAQALNEPLSSLFSPSSSFTSLFNAFSRIIGNVPTPAPDLEASTASLITEVCNRGHCPFVADYTLEICADPTLSSTDIRHMPVMQGDTCQAWVMGTAASIINELSCVMSGGNIMANPTLISKLSMKLAGLRTANDAIRSGRLAFDGVPTGARSSAWCTHQGRQNAYSHCNANARTARTSAGPSDGVAAL